MTDSAVSLPHVGLLTGGRPTSASTASIASGPFAPVSDVLRALRTDVLGSPVTRGRPSSAIARAPVGGASDGRPPLKGLRDDGQMVSMSVRALGRGTSTPGVNGSRRPVSAPPVRTPSTPSETEKRWTRHGPFGMQTRVCISMFLVQGGLLIDLLRPRHAAADRMVSVRLQLDGTTRVDNATNVLVTSMAQVDTIMRLGLRKCHPRSSAAHVVVRITVEVRADATAPVRRGSLFVVDCASPPEPGVSGGNERAQRDAEDASLSLHTLGESLYALRTNADVVPYRNHVLTQLLWNGLREGKVLLLLHVSPTEDDVAVSERTLRYGMRVRGKVPTR